jgi:hypothetical protein
MTRKNLTTDGTEFNLPDGSSYSGPYHIHVNRGAMKGGIHVSSAHPLLTPKNSAVANRVTAVQNELRAEIMRSSKMNQITSRPSSGGGSSSGGGY